LVIWKAKAEAEESKCMFRHKNKFKLKEALFSIENPKKFAHQTALW